MVKKLIGKVALITDGDGEMGQQVAHDLAKDGATIVILYQTADLSKFKKKIEKFGSECLLFKGPISHEILDQIIQKFKHLDILINTMSQKRLKNDTNKICLNMIVKNESSVIERCLNSVKPIIDSWVIVDTGSTDGTQKLIEKCLEGIPGELHEREWVDFATNRNQALELAKGKADYILFMDADDFLVFKDGFSLPILNQDFYYVKTLVDMIQYSTKLLVKESLDWKWVGPMHEVLLASTINSYSTLPDVSKVRTAQGARSKDLHKFKKDAEILEKALIEDPNNARHVFYLAESYKLNGDYDKAIKTYEKRIKMGGWDEEIYNSLLEMTSLQDSLNFDRELVESNYKKAIELRPQRAEGYYSLSRFYRNQGDFSKSYSTALQALKLPMTSDTLFVKPWVYDYGILTEIALSAFMEKHYIEAFLAAKLLLVIPNLPQEMKQSIQETLDQIPIA